MPRWLRVLLIVVGALAVLAVVVGILWSLLGDRLLREQVEQRIATEVLALDAVPDDTPVEVRVAGGPMLPQLLAGSLENVRIEVAEFEAGPVSGSAIVQATGVPLSAGEPVESVTASISIPIAAVEERVRESVDLDIERVRFLTGTLVELGTTLRAFGLAVPASVTVELSARDGDSIGLRPTDIALGDQHLDPQAVLAVPVVGPLAAPLLAPQPFCVADLIPSAFSLDLLRATSAGGATPESLEVVLSARDVVLSDAAFAPGTC